MQLNILIAKIYRVSDLVFAKKTINSIIEDRGQKRWL